MHRAIIYCRKSTDRDDKQQNSIESQLSACTRTIEQAGFALIDTLIESASAKKSGKRLIFESLISLCKKGKVDYIIVDEASRLSRNNTDSARILGLLEEGHIKAIYTTSQRYFGEQAGELLMLLLNLGMAKFDNDTRARNVKARMITCAEKGRCLGKAPFGYKNVTKTNDGKIIGKTVEIDPIDSEIVREIFRMRGLEKMSVPDIALTMQKRYGDTKRARFSLQGIDKMLKNPFYIGMVRYSGNIYQGEHVGIISIPLFQKVSDLERGFYTHSKDTPLTYLYKGLIKDEYGISLTGEIKKGKYIYYRSQNLRSLSRINISEKTITEAIIERLAGFYIPKNLYPLFIKIAREVAQERSSIQIIEEKELDREIFTLKTKEQRLLDGYLEGVIQNDDYKKGKGATMSKITLLQARKKELQVTKSGDIEKKISEMFELVENLSERYKLGDHSEKSMIHKKCEFELSVSNKKELTIKESKLLSDIKMLNFIDGSATENRTPVPGMRIPCPNH